MTPTLRLWLALKVLSLGLFAAGLNGAAWLAWLLLDPWFLWQIIVPSSRGFGPVVSRFTPAKREVWVTIDDGPDPVTTPRVLELLDAYGARATFFVIGAQVDRHPELVREIVRRGHTLGNHTGTHPCWTLWRSGVAQIGAEIDACNAALERAGVPPTRLFRMPVGIKTPFLHPALSRRGMDLVAWRNRGYDGYFEPQKAIGILLRDVQPGAIILLHEGGGNLERLAVTEALLRHLQTHGLSANLPTRDAFVS